MLSVSEKGLRERIEHIVKNWMWLRAPKAELEQALAATPAPVQGEKGLRERLDEALWWQENRIAHDYGECREETDGQLCLGCARILELEQALAATPADPRPDPLDYEDEQPYGEALEAWQKRQAVSKAPSSAGDAAPTQQHELEHSESYECKHCKLGTGYWPGSPVCNRPAPAATEKGEGK